MEDRGQAGRKASHARRGAGLAQDDHAEPDLFLLCRGLYGMQFWLPQIVKAFGLTNAQTGFVTAIPYLFGTVAMILWARHSLRLPRAAAYMCPSMGAIRPTASIRNAG
jgi:ACS family tartrate transporter-like MFS transporter